MEDGGWRGSIIPRSAFRTPQFIEPRFQILLETFLRLQIFSDDDDEPLRKKLLQQRGEERLCRRGDAGKRQRSASLQSPGEGLHGGSFQDVSEQIARR